MEPQKAGYHRTLERQIKKVFGRNAQIPAEWEELLALISETYQHYDQDRYMLERSIDLSSQELLQSNADLRLQQKELEETLAELKNTQIELMASQQMADMSLKLKKANEEMQQQQEELTTAFEDLQQAQQQLIQAEKMSSLGQLTAGIAHEINNPVNFIYVGIQALEVLAEDSFLVFERVIKAQHLLREGHINEANQILLGIDAKEMQIIKEDALDTMQSVKIGAERTSAIVKGLKHFSHSNNEESQYADLGDLLNSTMIILNNKLKDRITLKRSFEEIPLVHCIPGQLSQVFMNIISNAVDAIPHKGEISVSISRDEKFAVVTISDNGQGMPEQVRSRIFDPFFTTKEVGKGTGLGLSISYGIIQKHQGEIAVESKHGEGTTFIIKLPFQLMQ
jgi:signal transduction histidine kinase